jgi:hypothetical protein
MWQDEIQVEIEKTSYQLVLLFRGDELPRRHGAQVPRGHGAQVPRGFFLEGKKVGGRSRPADEKSKFSTPNVDERHFATLNAGEKSKFSAPDLDEKQQATSLLAWRLGTQTTTTSSPSILRKRNPIWLRRLPRLRHLPVGEV